VVRGRDVVLIQVLWQVFRDIVAMLKSEHLAGAALVQQGLLQRLSKLIAYHPPLLMPALKVRATCTSWLVALTHLAARSTGSGRTSKQAGSVPVNGMP
jgi:hypothetical protein